MLAQVDQFVVLDSVQFEKQSWQQRNRIKTPAGLQWLTVPVVFRGHFGQKICQVRIREPEFARKHLRAIELNYRRCAYFEQYYEPLAEIVRGAADGLLVDLNMRLVQWLCQVLGIRANFLRSSEMAVEGRRCELLIQICKQLNADFYVSPLGSRTYIVDDFEQFSQAGITVGFQNYEHPEYVQAFPPFCSYASAIDLVFNQGPHSRRIMESGRRQLLSVREVAEVAEIA